MNQVKKSKRPVMLTAKGKSTVVIQHAETYQRLLDIAARVDAEEGIRQRLEDAKKGKIRLAKSFLRSLKPSMALDVLLFDFAPLISQGL